MVISRVVCPNQHPSGASKIPLQTRAIAASWRIRKNERSSSQVQRLAVLIIGQPNIKQ